MTEGFCTRYLYYLDSLGVRVRKLSSRAQLALLWVLGEGLLVGLEAPDDWWEWIRKASSLGFRYVTTGEDLDDSSQMRAQFSDLCGTEEEMSEHLQSVIGCFFYAMGDYDGPRSARTVSFSFVFFPLMQSESLRLFEDVAQGDDEQEDEAFSQPRVQLAVRYVDGIVDRLAETPEPTAEFLKGIQYGSEVLSPCHEPGMRD